MHSARRRACLAGAWALAALLSLVGSPAAADIEIAIDEAPGSIALPDDWRPIPRAEVVEAGERAAQLAGTLSVPRPVAAFQRLPTLQWFTLPHALLFWAPAQPGGAVPPPLDDAEAVAPDLQIRHRSGRAGSSAVEFWQARVQRQDGVFNLDLYTRDPDGRALLIGMVAGLRERR